MPRILRRTPEPSEAHWTLVEDLGGPTAVAEILKRRLDLEDYSPQAVSMWRRRGIPFAYRPCLAAEATERHIYVPSDFLGEGESSPPTTPALAAREAG